MQRFKFVPVRLKLIGLFTIIVTFTLGLAVMPATSAPTATLVVNETLDLNDETPGDGACDTSSATSGDQCSLRAAIEEFNAQGPAGTPNRIEFNLPGTGPFTITPTAALPAITVPLVIDGVTQPGAACASATSLANLQIVLDGSSAGTGAIGLVLDGGSDGSTLRGLVIGNFNSFGIRIRSGSNIVRCSYIGIGADGVTDMGNSSEGIIVNGNNNTIGGQVAYVQSNVISNNTIGVRIEPFTSGNFTGNNFIGTTADGMSARGNNIGVYVAGSNNQIGSSGTLGRNVIGGNLGDGIRINGGQFILVQGNYIGVAADGATPLPNLDIGIDVVGTSTSNTIGGTAPGEANTVANNAGVGILVGSTIVGVPSQNELRGNAVYANGGLGIDLGANGVDVNDAGDADSGENQYQNYPVVTSTLASPVVVVALDSQANLQYTIDLYRNDTCDPSGYGEGQEHIFEGSFTANASGHAEFSLSVFGLATPGDGITGTATDPNGNTSEFSACATVSLTPTPTPTLTVTPTPTRTATATPTLTLPPTSTFTATATATLGPSPTGTSTPNSVFTPAFWNYLPIILQ